MCVLSAAPSVAFSDHEPAKESSRSVSDTQLVGELRLQLMQLEAEGRFSGTVLLAKHGRPLLTWATGHANRAFDARNDIDTKFYTASIAKLFTSTAILQLAGAGRLSLDDTLTSVLPDYPNQEVASQITIRQLLMMTAGISDYAGPNFGEVNPSRLQKIEDYLPFFVSEPLRFPPGTRQAYSNSGFLILGLVIERLSGQTFTQYVTAHVFEPAGMRSSGFYASEDDIFNLALGYTPAHRGPDAPLKAALLFGHGAEPAGGSGVYSTAGDMLRFAQAVRTGALLTQEYVDLLMTYTPSAFNHRYGWEQSYINGVFSTGHAGGYSGASTSLLIYPDLGYTVAVLSNYDGASRLVSERLRFRLTGQLSPQPMPMSQALLRQFAGTYVSVVSGPGMLAQEIYVTVERGALRVVDPREGKLKFVPLSAVEFFDYDMLSPRLVFTKDASGAVSGLKLTGIGPEPTTAVKQP
jgi:CubicO group peptidase (beta-lactamase class C family)